MWLFGVFLIVLLGSFVGIMALVVFLMRRRSPDPLAKVLESQRRLREGEPDVVESPEKGGSDR